MNEQQEVKEWDDGRWHFTLRRGTATTKARFTAKLTTDFSTTDDWIHLGRVAATLGVPIKPLPPTWDTPEAEHVWEWVP